MKYIRPLINESYEKNLFNQVDLKKGIETYNYKDLIKKIESMLDYYNINYYRDEIKWDGESIIDLRPLNYIIAIHYESDSEKVSYIVVYKGSDRLRLKIFNILDIIEYIKSIKKVVDNMSDLAKKLLKYYEPFVREYKEVDVKEGNSNYEGVIIDYGKDIVDMKTFFLNIGKYKEIERKDLGNDEYELKIPLNTHLEVINEYIEEIYEED